MPDAPRIGEAELKAEIERLEGLLAAASLQQVAEREAAAAEHARLTFELGHRVKNTLSVVQALASQTMRGAASPEAAIETFGARVIALARVNDIILRDSWTTTSLRSVSTRVLEGFGVGADQLAIEGDDLRIGASAALSFGMALQELGSNARRFGAWSRDTGRVTLDWRFDGAPPQTDLLLTWTETGGPAVTAPEKRGFGTRLIEQSLRSAFGRTVGIDYAPSGLVCRLRTPAADLAT